MRIPGIMEMAFVMIAIMYPSVTMMVEIAVHLMEIIGIAFARRVNVSSLPTYHVLPIIMNFRAIIFTRSEFQILLLGRVVVSTSALSRVKGIQGRLLKLKLKFNFPQRECKLYMYSSN